MGNYKNHILFFLVLFFFTIVVAGLRIYWINKALPSKATVLYIGNTRIQHTTQSYPVVSYHTYSGEVVSRGTLNLPISAGETVDILYNPDETKEFRLNTPYWLWFDIWSWYRMIWVAIALYYIVLFLAKRSSMRAARLRMTIESELQPSIGRQYPGNDPVLEVLEERPARTTKKRKPLSRGVKLVFLFMLPVSLFLVGQIWQVPYARQVAVVILLAIIAMGTPSGEVPDGDI